MRPAREARFDTPNPPTHNRRARPKGDSMSTTVSIAAEAVVGIARERLAAVRPG